METKNFKTEIINEFTNMDKANWLIAHQISFCAGPISIEQKVNKIQTLFVLSKYYEYILKGNDPYVLYVIVKSIFNGRRGFKLDESAHTNSFIDFITASLYAYQMLNPNRDQLSKDRNSLFVWSIISQYFARCNRRSTKINYVPSGLMIA